MINEQTILFIHSVVNLNRNIVGLAEYPLTLQESGYSANLLAARAPHSGDWLLVLPITACGLRLEDEAVRIAVALRLGSELGSSHTCRCGSLVEATDVHGLVCKQAPSRVVRHHALNECISRAFSAAGIPVRKL